MTPTLVTAIRSKQAVRLVLAREAETVKHMVTVSVFYFVLICIDLIELL
jgi:hypothetical protein